MMTFRDKALAAYQGNSVFPDVKAEELEKLYNQKILELTRAFAEVQEKLEEKLLKIATWQSSEQDVDEFVSQVIRRLSEPPSSEWPQQPWSQDTGPSEPQDTGPSEPQDTELQTRKRFYRKVEAKVDVFRVEQTESMVRIFFPDKPSLKIRKFMKTYKFWFDNANVCWQKGLSTASISQARAIEQMYKEEKNEN